MLIYNIFIHRHVFVLWLIFSQGSGGRAVKLKQGYFFAGGVNLKKSFLDSFSLLRLRKTWKIKGWISTVA